MDRTKPSLLFGAVLFALLLPSEAHASDMTGALVYVLGLGLIASVIIGLALALVLKFAFKCGHWVWALIPTMPIGAIVLLLLAQSFSGNYNHNYHAGPDLQYNGSHSVTVSPDFRQKELEQALELINNPRFKSELATYTNDPLSNYVFAIDLTAPGKRIARHYVTICVKPKVEVNTPVYEGIMYLFTKAVVATDPHPQGSSYTEPRKLR